MLFHSYIIQLISNFHMITTSNEMQNVLIDFKNGTIISPDSQTVGITFAHKVSP